MSDEFILRCKLPEPLSLFPKRPFFHKNDNKVSVSSNFFQFKLSNDNLCKIHKYFLRFEPPEISDLDNPTQQIMRKAEEDIKERLGQYTYIHQSRAIYSTQFLSEPFEVTIEYFGVNYAIKIKYAGEVDRKAKEAVTYYENFLHSLLKQASLSKAGRTYFDSAYTKTYKYGQVIMLGFKADIGVYQKGILLNLNTISKLVTFNKALDLIKNLSSKDVDEDLKKNENEVNRALKGCIVFTKYNDNCKVIKVFKVESVNFNLSPKSTFMTKKGIITYAGYYKAKYNITLYDEEQPLLEVKDNNNKVIYLIPELCYTDRASAEEWAKSKDNIREVIGKNYNLEESKKLLTRILSQESCKKEIDKWGMSIDLNLLEVNGRRINAGRLLFGGTNSQPLVNDKSSSNHILNSPMYSQPDIKEWNVFCKFLFSLYTIKKILVQ
jgi:uncharacterized protein YpiB (UPF0302 family)